MTRLAIALLMLSALTGCASMSGPKTQTIAVQTIQDHKEVEDAGCVIANGVGRWFVTTPGKITINKNVDDLTVECSKEDVGAGSETIVSKANAGLWGNILVGGPIGYVVDRKSGAGYDYPQTIIVVLKKENPFEEPALKEAGTEKAMTNVEERRTPSAGDEQPAVKAEAAAPAAWQDSPVQSSPTQTPSVQVPPAQSSPTLAAPTQALPTSKPAIKPEPTQSNDWPLQNTESSGTATPYISNY